MRDTESTRSSPALAARPQRCFTYVAVLPALRRTCFAVVANALALVRLRLADRADFGGELADQSACRCP